MIIVKSIETNNVRGRTVVLFADTQSEIPETGAATAASIGEELVLNAGDVIYTSDLQVGVLNTSDTWVWGTTDSSTAE